MPISFLPLYLRNIKTVILQDPESLRSNRFSVYDKHGSEVTFLHHKEEALSQKPNKTIQEEILLRLLSKHNSPKPMGPDPDPIIWVWLFMIPNIIIYPFIKTILDLCTRKPLSKDDLTQLNTNLEDLFLYKTEFDDFVNQIFHSSSRSPYQSAESRLLINELIDIKREATKFNPILQALADCFLKTYPDEASLATNLDTFCSTLTLNQLLERVEHDRLYKNQTQEKNNLTYKQKNVLWNRKNYKQLKTPDSLVDYYGKYYYELDTYQVIDPDNYRLKQLNAIKAYINNPDNNGKKLMQYIQAHLAPNMRSAARNNTLKQYAEEEISRLQQSFFSSAHKKADKIREALPEEGNINESVLEAALMIHRGFFKPIPTAYTNVYCRVPAIKC